MKQLIIIFTLFFSLTSCAQEKKESKSNEIKVIENNAESNNQIDEQEKVLNFIKGSKLINGKSNKTDLDNAGRISKMIVDNSKGKVFPLDALKKDDTYIILGTDYKNMLVYYYDMNLEMQESYVFGGEFEKKLKELN